MTEKNTSSTQENTSDESTAWAGIELNIPIDKVPPQGLTLPIKLTEEHKDNLKKALNLIEIENFQGEIKVTQSGKENFLVKGQISAKITQSCVITLEPVYSSLSEDINTKFVPQIEQETISPQDEIEINPLEEQDLELIEQEQLNIGKLIYETFSTSLDPYPRTEGAHLEWQEKSDNGENNKDNPFSVLKKLQPNGLSDDK